jgi:prolipoprotein diacylglyceryltransferase
VKFPYTIRIGTAAVQAHLICELLAYALAYQAYKALRRVHGDALTSESRWWIIAAAAIGSLIGGRILDLLEIPAAIGARWHDLSFLVSGGKTIVGALIGGLFAVELTKKWLGISQRTGDLFAVPICLGIVVGRIGCFLGGLPDRTYGIATTLPWAVDFGDGIRRHPTQLYEVIFVACLGMYLLRRMNRPHVNGDIFKMFMVAYFAFRLVCDFLKPDARVFAGLSSIQLACVMMLLYYAADVRRWLLPQRQRRPELTRDDSAVSSE